MSALHCLLVAFLLASSATGSLIFSRHSIRPFGDIISLEDLREFPSPAMSTFCYLHREVCRSLSNTIQLRRSD